MIMFVYRFEREGLGPYHKPKRETCSPEINKFINKLRIAHHNLAHPGLRDFDWNIPKHYYSACSSIEELFKWFKGHTTELLILKYKIVRYEIDSEYVVYGISRKQVIFEKDLSLSKKVIL